MKNLELLNAALCMSSFIIYFIALCLDFKDRINGTVLRRAIYFFCMLFSASLLIRVGQRELNNIVIFWFIVAALKGTAKWLQLKGKTKRVDRILNGLSNTMKGQDKRPAHN